MHLKTIQEKNEIIDFIIKSMNNPLTTKMKINYEDGIMYLDTKLISSRQKLDELVLFMMLKNEVIELNLNDSSYDDVFLIITDKLPLSHLLILADQKRNISHYSGFKQINDCNEYISRKKYVKKYFKNMTKFRFFQRFSSLSDDEKKKMIKSNKSDAVYPCGKLEPQTEYFCKLPCEGIEDDRGYSTKELFDMIMQHDFISASVKERLSNCYEYYHFGKIKITKYILNLSDEYRICSSFKRFKLSRHIFQLDQPTIDWYSFFYFLNYFLMIEEFEKVRRKMYFSKVEAKMNLIHFSNGLFNIPESHTFWKVAFITGSVLPACIFKHEDQKMYWKNYYNDSDIDVGVEKAAVKEHLGLDISDDLFPFVKWMRDTIIELHGITMNIEESSSKNKYRLTFEGYRPIELFSQEVGCIFNFHVAPVRGWFDGKNFNLLPSALIAYVTGVSIDFRYAKSGKSAVQIIKIYEDRGFTINLNKDERKAYNEIIHT